MMRTIVNSIVILLFVVVSVVASVADASVSRDVDRGPSRLSSSPRRALTSMLGSQAGASAPRHREHLSTGISKALVDRVAVDGAVIVTWANMHYYDFAINWLSHLDELGVTNYLIGAMDEELYAALRKIGVNTWLMGSQMIDESAVKKDFGWGSKNFHKMGRDKIRLIHDFTKTGVDVLISDIDVTWMRDPLPFVKRFPDADMLVSTDELRNTTHDQDAQLKFLVKGEGLEAQPCSGTANIGMMWFRSTKASQEITKEWVENLEADDKVWDQAEFNTLIRRGGCGSGNKGDGVGLAYDGKVRIGTLPVALFNNGHTYFVQRLHERVGMKPYAMHATFQYDGTPGKRNRMREANQWLGDRDNAAYFDQKFLSYSPRILKDVDLQAFEARGWPTMDHELEPLLEGDALVKEQLRLVQHQIAQLYEAVAIAKKLGRVVILPPFFCGLDRAWFPHRGKFPGSMLSLPYICPGDHVMAMESNKAFTDEYREYTFLGHPQMPEGEVVAANVRRVEVPPSASFAKTILVPDEYAMCFKKQDDEGKVEASEGDECVPARNAIFKSAQSIALDTPADSLDALKTALASASGVKFLHFDTIIGVTKASQTNPESQMRSGIWCCREGNHEKYTTEAVNLFEKGAVPKLDEGETKTNATQDVGAKKAKGAETEDSSVDDSNDDDAVEEDGIDAATIESGLMKYFHGDKKKVANAMELIHAETPADDNENDDENDDDENDKGQNSDDKGV